MVVRSGRPRSQRRRQLALPVECGCLTGGSERGIRRPTVTRRNQPLTVRRSQTEPAHGRLRRQRDLGRVGRRPPRDGEDTLAHARMLGLIVVAWRGSLSCKCCLVRRWAPTVGGRPSATCLLHAGSLAPTSRCVLVTAVIDRRRHADRVRLERPMSRMSHISRQLDGLLHDPDNALEVFEISESEALSPSVL